MSFQKAKVLAQKKEEREGSNRNAEGVEGRGIETPATEAVKAPSQFSVARRDEADASLRKRLEELTVEMRAKFGAPHPAPTTITRTATAVAATETPYRPDNVIPTTPSTAVGNIGNVESIEDRVKRDIEHAQKIIQEGAASSASSSSGEVLANRDWVNAPAASNSSNARTLMSEKSDESDHKTPSRTHAPSILAAVATAEESLDIPVRDTSSLLTKESDKLKLKVSEVYARHQSDLEAIRNSNLGIDLPPTLTQRRQREQQQEQQALLDAFSAKRSGSSASHPTAAIPSMTPVAVPKADAAILGSGDDNGGVGGNGGHRSPHKLHIADPSSDDGAATTDPFNFMATARRTFEEVTSVRHRAQVHHRQQQRHQQRQEQQSLASEEPQGNAALSEGPLSTSWVSSTGADGEGGVANREGGRVHAASILMEAAVGGGALKKALVGKDKKSKRRGSGGSNVEPAHSSQGPATEQKSVSAVLNYNFYRSVIVSLIGHSLRQIVPEALKLRFMAELNQLEGIQHLENQLNKMGSVRDVALANQNAEKMAQKIRVSYETSEILAWLS